MSVLNPQTITRRFILAGTAACAVASVAIAVLAQRPQTAPALSTPTALDAPELVQRYQQTITASDLAGHLYTFSSDYFQGRETTTDGQKLAAYYLAGQYRKIGLKPAGTATSPDSLSPEAYFQPFNVYARSLNEAHLEVVVNGETTTTAVFMPGQQYDDLILAFGNVEETTADVVFAGYGIKDSTLAYDDFAALQAEGIDLSNRWVLLLPNEPLVDSTRSLLPTPDGRPSTNWTVGSSKISAARQFGPAGFLIVGDAGPRVDDGWIEVIRRSARRESPVGSLSLEPWGSTSQFPPAYIISSRLANEILGPTGRTVAELIQDINEDLEPVVFEIEGVTVTSTIPSPNAPLETENVIAYIEGNDPVLKDEVVVLTSHYDHVGVNPALTPDGIYNGADDNGSGTVALLEIAEAFMEATLDGYGPRRSIVFLNVSGEEKGLLGSAYYTDVEPVFPIDKTVANLNLDMVGRYDPSRQSPDSHYVYIIGSNLISQELHDINTGVNELTGIRLELDERYNRLDDPNRLYARSDQWNFGKHGIPFIFYFTGLHEDYHKPGDEAHKIAYPRMADIAQLVFATAWQIANQDTRPAITGTF